MESQLMVADVFHLGGKSMVLAVVATGGRSWTATFQVGPKRATGGLVTFRWGAQAQAPSQATGLGSHEDPELLCGKGTTAQVKRLRTS